MLPINDFNDKPLELFHCSRGWWKRNHPLTIKPRIDRLGGLIAE